MIFSVVFTVMHGIEEIFQDQYLFQCLVVLVLCSQMFSVPGFYILFSMLASDICQVLFDVMLYALSELT